MLYIIIAYDHPDSLQKRSSARPAHVARLQTLQNQGRLVIAGPMPAIDNDDPGPAGYIGSALIVDFDTLEDARAWAESDPYVAAGVYARIEVHPFRQTFP
ncbi:YciI family protein [Acidihalobacter prosperus]